MQKQLFNVTYRDHLITHKADFGNGFLIDGMPCTEGYVVTRGGVNVIPGAGWFLTVKDAKLGIDCLIQSIGIADHFHALFREAKAAQAAAPALVAALQEAESFMRGFEDDPLQEGINEQLARIRSAIALATPALSELARTPLRPALDAIP